MSVVFVLVLMLFTPILAIAAFVRWVRRKRSAEAAGVAAQIADALLCDGRLEGCAMTATVQLPFWRRSPPTVRLTAEKDGPELRQLARRIVMQELPGSVRIEHLTPRDEAHLQRAA